MRILPGVIFIGLFVFCSCKPWDKKPTVTANKAVRQDSIFIQPFDDMDDNTLQFVATNLQKVYKLKTKILPLRKLPANAYYPARHRYLADSLLRFLLPLSGNNRNYIMGVTGKDISTKHNGQANWGIMGLGFTPGNSCIISDYRLQAYPKTRETIDTQLLKVAIHELGHNLGLSHCPDTACYMADAGGKNVLDQEHGFCKTCTLYLQSKDLLN